MRSILFIVAFLIGVTVSAPIVIGSIGSVSLDSGGDTSSTEATSRCAPLRNATGRLAVYTKSNGTFLGFVSKNFQPDFSPTPTWRSNIYTVGDSSSALVVTLPSRSFATLSHVFNIATNFNEPDPAHPWFGAAEFDDPIGVGQAGFALLTGTSQGTVPGAPSLSTTINPQQPSGESKIWTLDCTSRHLIAHWININESSVVAILFYIVKGNGNSNGGDGLGIYKDQTVVANTHFLGTAPVNIKFFPL